MTKDIDKSLASLFIDLKGRKTKINDWMALADKCAEALREFRTRQKAADKLNVSLSLFNAIMRLRKLDPRVQEMVRRREILMDSAQRLNTIQPKDKQYQVAKLLVGASNKQQREIIQHARRLPDSDLMDFRRRVVGKPIQEKLRVLILPLPEEMYRSLEDASRRAGKPIEKILPEIIGKWLGKSGAAGK